MLRHATYNLRGGFLVRPLTIALALGCAGAFLSWLEEEFPAASAWVPTVLFPMPERSPRIGVTAVSKYLPLRSMVRYIGRKALAISLRPTSSHVGFFLLSSRTIRSLS